MLLGWLCLHPCRRFDCSGLVCTRKRNRHGRERERPAVTLADAVNGDDALTRVELATCAQLEQGVTYRDARLALVLEARGAMRQDAPHVRRADEAKKGVELVGRQKVSPWSGTPAQASFTRFESGLFWFGRLLPCFVAWMPLAMMLLSKPARSTMT